MKSTKSSALRKSAVNTPNNQSGYTTRKNTQIVNAGFTKDDVVSPQKQSQFFQAQQQAQQQQNEQYQKGNINTNSRIEYTQNMNSSNPNYSMQNGRTPDNPNSQSNLEDYQYQMQQSQQQQQQYYNQQNMIGTEQSNKKILRTIRSEAKLFEVAQGNVQNIDFNYSIVDNLIAKRGFTQEKMVPMELFQETMQYFERRLTGIEQRIDDNEQLVHLSDRLMELRTFNPNNSLASSGVKDRYGQQTPYSQNQQMSPTGVSGFTSYQQMANSSLNRGGTGNYMTSTFGSAQTYKNTSYGGVGNSAPPKQTDSRIESYDQNNFQGQNMNNINIIDLHSKMTLIEKKTAQFDEFTKSFVADVEKKFGEYSKKLNIQMDKFFKSASSRMEQFGEKDQKLSSFQETILQKMEIMNQTFVLKQEELVINKEELNDNIKTINALLSKLENRINEHSIDLEENRTLIKGIEDDLFVMLQNYKELSEGVQKYRNLSDDIMYLKQNQANILKNININPIHYYKN